LTNALFWVAMGLISARLFRRNDDHSNNADQHQA
ncbi:cobalt transporter, partial [Pseudomonas syringae pv. tagetis]